MPKITIPFLPKTRLIQYLQTQCQVNADGERGPFGSALDLDLSHIHAHAAVERVSIVGVEIEAQGIRVAYDVHYRIFNGCTGVDIQNYLDHQLRGRKAEQGWEFETFAMPAHRSTVDEF